MQENKLDILADFIVKSWHYCPLPGKVTCRHWFGQRGCRECLKNNAELLRDEAVGPWYTERWYEEDLESVLKKEGVPASEENVKKLKEVCRMAFSDKSERNEMIRKMAADLKNKEMKMENYTIEWCPWCESEVVIYATGITACPECGKPLAPCSMCEDCTFPCPYGCDGSVADEKKEVTNPAISIREIIWYQLRLKLLL